MNKVLKLLLFGLLLSFGLSACESGLPEGDARTRAASEGEAMANSVNLKSNGDQANIKRRIEATQDPTTLGFILLINEAGQPILYEGVEGKVTSSGKRLTSPDYLDDRGYGDNTVVRQAPSDEGSYGSSEPYIYWWNTAGTYRQTNVDYLYSLQPIELTIEPLVVTALPAQEPPPASQ